ncbi:PKD domain-containing protein [Blastococcus sp. SYSU D00820]
MGERSARALKRVVATAVCGLLTAGAVSMTAPAVARADSLPTAVTPTTPPTVAADALPTVQVDGVVWSQVVVGDRVYAAGSFTRARPAGAPPGQQETVRNNLLAYDIRTGELVTSFAPDLNGQALAVSASPDGSRVYVGGDFTVADGQPRNRVAAYDVATGALVASFRPSVNGQVAALAATNSTVYLGGDLSAVGGVSRSRLAAVRSADGGLLPWAPVPGVGPTTGNTNGNRATSNAVMALVVTGGGAQVVAGGRFDSMNGVKSTGVAALDPVSGATRPFAAGQQITNQGINSAVYSLSTDGSTVYGTAYNYYGPGNLEGSFVARADGGALVSVNDCWGDTYSSYATGGVVYLAGHAHNCDQIRGFPEQTPERVHKYATAVTAAGVGADGGRRQIGGPWMGRPAPVLLPWFPAMASGTYTGQYQAGWSVTGTSQYVVYGGEFPRVNGTGQQGLVRFAVPSIAPNRMGPAADAELTPTLVSRSSGTVRVSWKATSDVDNGDLTYTVTRSGQQVHRTTAASTWWHRPELGFVDRGLTPGTTQTYRVDVSDPFGNTVSSSTASVVVSGARGADDAYSATVLADGPEHYWRLDEPAGSRVAYDSAGFEDLALGSGVAGAQQGGLTGSTDTAASFDGTAGGIATMTNPLRGAHTLSVEAWFSTRSTAGGVLLDFGDATSGLSVNHDRHVYLDEAGRVSFGVWPGYGGVVSTTKAYNDGRWHHVVATLGPDGIALYLDGSLAARRTDPTAAQDFVGYWRLGGDTRWAGTTDWFAGRLDEVAVYPGVLTAAQVQRHFAAGTTGSAPNAVPRPAFTATADGLVATLDAGASTDPDGTVSRISWAFGDGTAAATGARVTHTFPRAGSYRVAVTVTDDRGATASTSRVVAVAATGVAGSPYAQAVLAAGPAHYWRLGEASGSGLDSAGAADLAVGSGVRRPAAGAVSGDADGAASFDGTGSGLAVTPTAAPAPNQFSVELWFRTTSTAGGKLLGYGDARSGQSYNNDRHLYLDQAGRLTFGVWPQEARTLSTAPGLNDGRWHQVVASLGTTGMALYVDGVLVGSRTDTRAGQEYTGYWRIGGDTTWAGAPYVTGDIDEVSIYPSVLPAGVVAEHHRLATTTPAVNVPPTAAFTAAAAQLTASFDAGTSADADGRITSFAWSFGDGSTATGRTAVRTYTAAGTYSVRLTVTDDRGATATTERAVTVTAPVPNRAPAAAATVTATGLTVAVSGAGSTDADGTVTGWAWTFGDGGTATGPSATHTYAAAGTYTVGLTVTDDDGATATTTRTVTVTAPAGPPVVAADTFNRTVTGGLGTAEVGGAWTATAGATRLSVTPGAATLALPGTGNNTGAHLAGVAETDVEVRATVALAQAPTGAGSYVYVTGRRVGANEYRMFLRIAPDGSVGMSLSRIAGGVESWPGGEVVLPAGTWTAGAALEVRLRVTGTGTTTVQGTVWRAGTAEPAAPQLVRTDTTAVLQAAGSVGIAAYRPGSATGAQSVRVTAFTVTRAG